MTNIDARSELEKKIRKQGTVRFASGSFTQKYYSNGTASPIEHKVQEIIEIGIDDLMQAVDSYVGERERLVRVDELQGYPLNWADNRNEPVWREMVLSRIGQLENKEG